MNACTEIVKRLERNTAAGAYLSQVFTDWLDLTHATPGRPTSPCRQRSDQRLRHRHAGRGHVPRPG